MKVLLSSYYTKGKKTFSPGEECEIPDEKAKAMIKARGAKPIPEETEKAVKEEPQKETR